MVAIKKRIYIIIVLCVALVIFGIVAVLKRDKKENSLLQGENSGTNNVGSYENENYSDEEKIAEFGTLNSDDSQWTELYPAVPIE